RARRLVGAADAAWRGGLHRHAVELLRRSAAADADPAVRIAAEHVRAGVEADCGDVLAAADALVHASERAAAVDATVAIRMLVEAAEAAAYAGDSLRTAELGRRAAILPVEGKPAVFMSGLLQGMGRIAEGDSASGAALLRQATAIAEQLDDPRQLLWAGVAARFVGDEAAGRAWYGKATARVRELGAVGELPHALEYLAELEMRAGRYGRAIAHATEGLALARDLGQDTSTCRHLATLAFVTALRGEEDACRGHAREALSRAAARGLGLVVAVATHALAMLELGLGRPAAALVHLRAMLAARPGAGSPFLALYCVPDLVEAAARAGDRDGIDEPLAAFERIVGPSGAPGAQAILHRVRAFAADGDPAGAEERFAEALRWSGLADQPFELARTRLLYGEHLRRDKRRTEARGQLRAALEGFDALGAVPWSERARAELRATGETARRRSPDPVVQLTAQERQIVRLVAEGATNQQVGAQLFISKRTVEYHLHNVFTKLGVSSRTALARLPVD
ncbi:MAG TPA: LuxR C-terminal-related transcriptional regulator, partial [Pilimelia sp.]|nr:LuxR C-terminal-related transcriptional regulator [Pilimelia sp.]